MINILRRIATRQPHPSTGDLISHFSEDQAEAIKRLQQHYRKMTIGEFLVIVACEQKMKELNAAYNSALRGG
jgi:hypothetical protein